MPCGVCEKHSTLQGLPGGIVFQNESVFVAHFPFEEGKAHFGHLILEFKRHLTDPAELTEQEAVELGLAIPKLSRLLKVELGAEHVYIFRIGDLTPHLHFHFVPRFPGTPREAWGTGLYQSPLGKKATAAEIREISERIRSRLETQDS